MNFLPEVSVTYLSDNFEESPKQWDSEEENENSELESDVGSDAERVEISEHDTDSTIEGDSDSNDNSSEEEETPERRNTSRVKYYFGKNKYRWCSEPEEEHEFKPTVAFESTGMYGPLGKLKDSLTPEIIWNFLIDEPMLQEILIWTNVKIRKEKERSQNRIQNREVDLIELRAFIGLLLYTAAFKSHDENIESIFATDGTGREIFRAAMAKTRFVYLLKILRFDNPETRKDREKQNPATAILLLFERFVVNCQRVYTVGSCATMDEMLIGFRGRCKFKMYIPGKKVKCGLKIMALTDSKSHYFYNGYIYTGKKSDGTLLTSSERALPLPIQSALRLTKPIQDTNRNITADNWFTSLELVNTLKNRGLTYLGAIKKNKKEIPRQFLPNRKRERFSTMYGFAKDIALISYVPKKNKGILLLSTMHHANYATDSDMNNPEIVCYFNNKSGVDSLDETCRSYTTGRRTSRWSMTIFFRILDISVVNSHILHNSLW